MAQKKVVYVLSQQSMAFSKTPEVSSLQQRRIKAVGESHLVSGTSQFPTTLNYVNCFPIQTRQFGTDPNYRIVKREPVQEAFDPSLSSGTSANLPSYVVPALTTDKVFFARNDTVYYVSWNSGTPTITSAGSSGGAVTYAFPATNAVDSSGANLVAWVGSNTIVTVNEDGTGYAIGVITPTINPAAGLEFMNGYLFAVGTDGYIYNSTAGGVLTTWSSTDKIRPEINPDPVLYIGKHKNRIVAFSSQSIEFFVDSAIAVGSPLQRDESYTIPIGVSTPLTSGVPPLNTQKTIAKIGEDIYFIGRQAQSPWSVFRIRNFNVEEVATQYVLRCINGSTGNFPATANVAGVETIMIRNEPMIRVYCSDTNYDLVYWPDKNIWWLIDRTWDFADISTSTGVQLGVWFFQDYWWTASPNSFRRPWKFMLNSSTTANLTIATVDLNHGSSVTSSYFSEILDFDSSNEKHVTSIDCVGDYGDNTVTLSYSRYSDYSNFVSMGTKTPSTLGPLDPVRFDNPGDFRRLALKVTLTGTGDAYHEAFDINYEQGTS